MKTNRVIPAVALIICASALPAFAQSITVVSTFDYPNAVDTVPTAISDKGDICGYFIDAAGVYHGFIRRPSGAFPAPLDDPHGNGTDTEADGINDSGLISGGYNGHSGDARGFFYHKGDYTTFNVPGYTSTSVSGLNNAGDFVGEHYRFRTWHGFISVGGNLTDIDIPGTRAVFPNHLNDSDAVVGIYISGNVYHGFYMDAQGVVHYPIDAPGATLTHLNGINDQGWIVGRYNDAGGSSHGLLYQPPDTFITYDYPGTAFTSIDCINRHGDIAGVYTDSAGNYHGYLAKFSPGN